MKNPRLLSLAKSASSRLSQGLWKNHNNNKGGKEDAGVDLWPPHVLACTQAPTHACTTHFPPLLHALVLVRL